MEAVPPVEENKCEDNSKIKMQDFYFILSQRGRRMLIYNGYKYRMHRIPAKETKVMWRCDGHRCPARVYLNIEETKIIELRGIHNHKPVPENRLAITSINNCLKQDSELVEKSVEKILQEKLPQISDIPLNNDEKRKIRNNLYRQRKIVRERQLYGFENFEESEDTMVEQTEGQQQDIDMVSEESLDNNEEDYPTPGSEPEPAFVPIGVASIKEEPVETPEVINFTNTYSEELSLNDLSEELNISGLDVLNGSHSKSLPPVSSTSAFCENTLTMDDRHCDTNKSETINTCLQNRTPNEKDLFINHDTNKNLASDFAKVITGNDNDITNLKNVLYKLEKISDTLAIAAMADQYDQFGKYLASLLRGIPQKKFLSLKQKIIDDVIKAKMALDELDSPSPSMRTCTSSTYLERHKRNTFSGKPDGIATNKFALSGSARDYELNQTSSIFPNKIPDGISSPVLVSGTEERKTDEMHPTSNRGSNTSKCNLLKRSATRTTAKHQKKQCIEQIYSQHKPVSISMEGSDLQPTEEEPLRCIDIRCEVEIEEGTELQEFKPDIINTSTSRELMKEPISDASILKEPGGINQRSEVSIQVPSASTVKILKSSLFCQKCSLDFYYITDLEKHFMIKHPNEVPVFDKTCQTLSPKTPSQETLHSSATSLVEQIKPGIRQKEDICRCQHKIWPPNQPVTPR